MRNEYITVSGKHIIREYKYWSMNHKPTCRNCRYKLKRIFFRDKKQHKSIGYYCKYCHIVYLYEKYNIVLSIKRIKNNKKKK